MRFRPSGDRFLFFFFAGFVAAGATAAVFFGVAAVFLGLPTAFFGAGAALPPSNARACCKSAISRSTQARISDTPIVPP
jgi:hypothetical protein